MKARDRLIMALNACIRNLNGIEISGVGNAEKIVRINNSIVDASKAADEMQAEIDALNKEKNAGKETDDGTAYAAL